MSAPRHGFDPAIAAAFACACEDELLALKPGNVHVHAPGHRMNVSDFRLSAAVAAPFIAERGQGIGARVLGAARATWAAVGCNTNLGILLLAAPLARAAEGLSPGAGAAAFARAVEDALEAATLSDTEDVFDAIRLMAPAGLGRADTHDVATPPAAALRAVMRSAADRDMIAAQYGNGFADIFGRGLTAVADHAGAAAAQAAFFTFAAGFPDTHVVRKHGAVVAERTRRRLAAVRHLTASAQQGELLALDAALKEEGINPGTSADLTVATLFASHLLREPSREALAGRPGQG